MNLGMRWTALSATALVLAAGSAMPALAQNEQQPPKRDTKQPAERAGERAMLNGVDFRDYAWFRGRDVINETGEKVADVSDLVVDRGSGAIDYVVLKTGTVLGLGGKHVAVPYSSMRWNDGMDKFVLSSSKEQLKTYPEFDAKKWSAMMESKKEERKEARHEAREADKEAKREAKQEEKEMKHEGGMLPGDHAYTDPYAGGGYDATKSTHIEGEVKNVERVRTAGGEEETVLTIAANDGTTKKVTLGPSWFVSGGTVAPTRGDKVVVDSYAVTRTPDYYTANRIRLNDREFELRQKEGGAACWCAPSLAYEGRSYQPSYWHYVLASDLKGMKLDCRNAACGKVDDVVMERHSGQVAFLSIDPDKNFLGIADTKRLVPWQVIAVSLDGRVRIDATKDMILASPETPHDINLLSTGNKSQVVYSAYQISPPSFEARRQTAAVPANINENDPWGSKGVVVLAIDNASAKTLRGTIVDVSDVSFDTKTIQPAKALRVKTDAGEELVLLGPAWYVDAQGNAYRPGEAVTMDVCRTKVNGKSYWITRSVEYNGRRTAMWENDRPVWDNR